jgi:hypothetical protein
VDHKTVARRPVRKQGYLGLQHVPHRTLLWDSNEHLSNRLAIGRLSGFKHEVPQTDLIERVIGNRLLCHRVGRFPDKPTIRGENPKRIGNILQFKLFSLTSAHLGGTRNALTLIFDDIGVLLNNLGQRLCQPQQLAI